MSQTKTVRIDRQQFEQAILRRYPKVEMFDLLARWDGRTYKRIEVQGLWDGWRMRAAFERQQVTPDGRQP